MSWRAITVAEFDAELSPQEVAAINAVKGNSTTLATLLADIAPEWVALLAAAENAVASDGSVPDEVRRHVKAEVVWQYVTGAPKLPIFQTEKRRKAAEAAEAAKEQIRRKTFGKVAPPAGVDLTTGNWNSAPAILGRMSPVPQPREQLQAAPTPLFANPNAPGMDVPLNAAGTPGAPPAVCVRLGDGQVVVQWDPGLNAAAYNVYRGPSPQSLAVVASGQAGPTYTDTGLANGTTYYYAVASVNSDGLVSALTTAVSATPEAGQL